MHSSEEPPSLFVKKIAVRDFNRLIIRSDITIMLIESKDEDSIRIEGSKKFVEKVFTLQSDKELIIRARSFKDLKKKVIVYVPVHSLKNIEISAAAKVVSYNTLQSPVLNILVNGNCTIDLMLKGKLNIRESEGYVSTYRRVYENKTPLIDKEYLND